MPSTTVRPPAARLRDIQRGDIVCPKSTTPSRIKENYLLFDFELTDDDMAAITALDKGEEGRIGAHPDTFAHVPR